MPKTTPRALTFEQAQTIRNTYNLKRVSYRELSKQYQVSLGTIQNIIQNKTYKEE